MTAALTPGGHSRRALCMAALAAWAPCSPAQAPAAPARRLREMQIFEVRELGLAVWVENQPPWEARLIQDRGRPLFVAESPDHHHPPMAMTFSSWPEQRVAPGAMLAVAASAIRRASENFGLAPGQARGIAARAASHGVLSGAEGRFAGRVDGVLMDVAVFVGQAPGRFPVALSLYTIAGKMPHASEVLRRSWGRLSYL
jgi:ABC-type amino acid transport substrate-binding protein